MFAWIPSQICVDSESYLDRCTLGDAPAGQLGRPGPAPGFAPGAVVAAGIPAGGAPRRRSSHRVLRLGSARSWPVQAGPEARGQIFWPALIRNLAEALAKTVCFVKFHLKISLSHCLEKYPAWLVGQSTGIFDSICSGKATGQ